MSRTIWRRIIGATSALLVVGGLAACGPAAPDKSSIPNDEASLVSVQIIYTAQVVYPSNGGPLLSDPVKIGYGCTGFFAGTDGQIVTAGHCVAYDDEVKQDIYRELLMQPALQVPEEDVDTYVQEAMDEDWPIEGMTCGKNCADQVVSVAQNPSMPGAVIMAPKVVQIVDKQPFDNGDLALLHAADLGKPTVPLTISTSKPVVQDKITAIGYPGKVSDIVDPTSTHASFKDGSISSTQTRGGVQVLEVDAAVSQGMSGGPTVNDKNEVIGVNSFGYLDSGTNFITNPSDLLNFVKKNGVDYKVPEAPSVFSQYLWYIVAGGVVAVLVVVAVVVAVARGRRAKGSVTRSALPCGHPDTGAAFCPSCGKPRS